MSRSAETPAAGGVRVAGAARDALFDPLSPEFQADPYRVYARLRREAPVFALEAGGALCTRYDEVSRVLRDPAFSAERFPDDVASAPDAGALARSLRSMMLLRDAPAHTRLRGLASKAFTPRVVERLRARVAAVAAELCDAVEPAGGMDVIRDFAAPLPVVVIAELLGVPAADHADLKRWSDDLAVVLDGSVRAGGLPRAAQAAEAFAAYLREVVAARRAAPRDDLISRMGAAQEREDALSDDELIATAMLLLAAGHETTTNLLGNGLLALLRHPAELARLRAEPALIRSCVEELLRYDSPVQLTTRHPLRDLELCGVCVPRGAEINLLIGSANRDPARFPEPDRLDIARSENRHLSFGLGAHFCLGAPLARLEAQVALELVLRRFPGLALASDALKWRPGLVLRGLTALPVRF